MWTMKSGPSNTCWKDERARGAYNLTAPYPVTSAEFARALGSVLHRPSGLALPPLVARNGLWKTHG